ncbi:SAM-dependent methyltransferase [Streptomyces sp. NPDC053427]|uniref:SAM-dependent methyltransferase n=1 Tax=Streptomyces sp. NPDC053427 TaxID=3365701 RepID=UPI0037D1350E
MPFASGFASESHLSFHGPLSTERADRLAAELAARNPVTVVDYGCGWGELLLRILDVARGTRGVGIDVRGPDIARGRDNAANRGLADRVDFIEGSATDHSGAADVVINCGAYQAFGAVPEALTALRRLVNPGGVLLFGADYWERTPSEQQLAHMWPGTTVDECFHLPDLVDVAIAAGFRPLRIQTATRDELEEFESGYAAGAEEWLLANRDHPEAEQVRTRLDDHRSIWLRGLRDVWGFAYLTLGVPGS